MISRFVPFFVAFLVGAIFDSCLYEAGIRPRPGAPAECAP